MILRSQLLRKSGISQKHGVSDGKSDQEIIDRIKAKYGLTQEQAEEYVLAPDAV